MNDKITRRVEAALDYILALCIGVGIGAALVSWWSA